MFKVKIGKFTTEIRINPHGEEIYIRDSLNGFLTNEKTDIIMDAQLVENFTIDDYKGPAPATRITLDLYDIKWYYFSGMFNLSKGYAKVKVYRRHNLITSLLRIIYTIKAINSNGLFVHAASFVKDGRAYLFPGKSGAGKSTLSKIAALSDPSLSLLSDEISYISLEQEKVFAYSTPFWGNTKIKGEYIKSPLSKIYFIKQSKKNYTKTLDVDMAATLMLENILYASVDSESFNKSFDTMKKILKRTKNAVLNFTKDERFLEVI